MRLLIVLVSRDDAVRALFDRRKQGLVPRDVLSRPFFANTQVVVDTRSCPVDKLKDADTVGLFVRDVALETGTEAILILHDERVEGLTGRLRDAALLARYDAARASASPENVLQQALALGLRDLAALGLHMRRHDDLKILLLPLNNFHAWELDALNELVRLREGAADFPDRLAQQISILRRNRQRPKPTNRRRAKFLIDERDRFFEYGFEHHAQVATAGGRHQIACDLNSRYRFGHQYDRERHFNVSFARKEDSFEGEICDCHEDLAHIKRKGHLNLFPNGFY